MPASPPAHFQNKLIDGQPGVVAGFKAHLKKHPAVLPRRLFGEFTR
jgi:hypothetical protein